MYFTNCTIWLSAIVLQGGTIHSAPKWITEDVIKSILEQKIIKLIRLYATKSVRDMGFNFP